MVKKEDHKKEVVILQILPALKSGGVERGVVEITKALVRGGFKSLVASNGGVMVANINNAGGQHIQLPLASKNPITIFKNIKKIEELIKGENVDIVHARSRAPAWSAYFACKNTKIPFITTFHGLYSFKTPWKKFYNSVMVKGKIVIAASKFIQDHIIENYKIDKRNIRLISRGVDLTHFDRKKVSERRILQMAEKLAIEHDRPIIMLPGRITAWKGHEFFLEALSLLPKGSFLALLVGDNNGHDNYIKRIHNKIKSYKLNGSVRIVSHTQDMPAMYSIADIVVSASLRPEAFGRVAIEAQAMERLLVATNHGGSCETVIDEKTGWLVEAGDVESLARILEKLINIDDKDRKKIVVNAKKNIHDNFSLTSMTDKTIKVYKEILKKG